MDTGFWEGLVAGLAVAAGGYALARWRLRRPTRARTDSRSPAVSVPAPALSVPVPPTPIERPFPTPSPVPSVSPVAPESIRLSERVLAHLLRHASVTAEGEHGNAVTQRGIGSAVGATQGALSNVLRRLEDGGVIVRDKAHVRGRSKRVNVYGLTTRGRELALGVSSGPAPPRVGPSVANPTLARRPASPGSGRSPAATTRQEVG